MRWSDAIDDSVRILALGEGTHGTREFVQVRQELILQAVDRLATRTLALEASYSAGRMVDAYAAGLEDDVDQALAGLDSWIWNNEETRDLLTCLRGHNVAHPHDRVRVVGIDIYGVADSRDRLHRFAMTLDGAAAATAARGLAAAQELERQFRDGPAASSLNRDQLEERRRAVEALAGFVLDAHQRPVSEFLSSPELEQALGDARSLSQFADAFVAAATAEQPERAWIETRDRLMADNVGDLVRRLPAGQRVVLLAHNAHVGRADIDTDAAGGHPGGPETMSMGGHLAREFADRYYAIGFLFGEGRFLARDIDDGGRQRVFDAGPPDRGTIEAALAAVALANPLLRGGFVAPLPAVAPLPFADWLRTPRPHRLIGAGYSSRAVLSFTQAVPPGSYDAMVYVPASSPSTPLRLPRRQEDRR